MLADIRVILWKEWQEFKRRAVADSVVGALLTLAAAFLVPSALVEKQELFGLLPPGFVLGAAVMAMASFYASGSSQMSFSEERASGTLCMLLTTRLSPAALVIGKCISLLIPCILLSVVMLILQDVAMILILYRKGMQTEGYLYTPLTALIVLVFSGLYNSYTISSNAFLSLMIRNIRTLRQLGIFPMMLPLFAAWGCLKLFGASQLTVYALGLSLLILTLAGVLASLLVFTNEKVRLR